MKIPIPIQNAFNDVTVNDLCINGQNEAFLDRGSGLEPIHFLESDTNKNQDWLRDWVLELLSSVGKSWDAKHPFVDATLPSGHRLHVAFPPLARQGLILSLRRLPQVCSSSSRSRWQNSPHFNFLSKQVKAGDSVVISGATGSGKTTLANDLIAEIPQNIRIIALEDTSELAPQHPHFISLVSRAPNADGFGEVTLRTLLKQTLRMRPDRIILGECRGAEVLDLLQVLNTGHRGALTTLHANSPRDALRRIELLCLLASGGSLPSSVIRELLSLGIQWVVQIQREGMVRRISELWKIEGREGDTILMRQVLE